MPLPTTLLARLALFLLLGAAGAVQAASPGYAVGQRSMHAAGPKPSL